MNSRDAKLREVMRYAEAPTGVTVAIAARALGVSPRMVRRYLELGAPRISQGARGRSSSLVDVQALRAWRETREYSPPPAPAETREFVIVALRIATRIIVEQYRGRPSRLHAAELAGLWFDLASELRVAAGAGELADIPTEIRSLERLGAGSI